LQRQPGVAKSATSKDAGWPRPVAQSQTATGVAEPLARSHREENKSTKGHVESHFEQEQSAHFVPTALLRMQSYESAGFTGKMAQSMCL